MLSGHRVHHRLIFDNVVPFVYLLSFVAQVLIHLVTRTIVVVVNIGIDTYHWEIGGISNKIITIDTNEKSLI